MKAVLHGKGGSRIHTFSDYLRRSLLVGILFTLLILLWLYYAGDSRRIPFTPSVLPSGGTQDMFLRPTEPRVVILIMTNRIDDALCYSVGSAYLSGLPVVVAGYRMKYRGFLSKFEFMEAAIKNAELKPEDVVIAMDSDTIFTGVDINPFLDRFIAQSATTPEKLDALAVRQGRAMAPLLASAEAGCWAPNLFDNVDNCKTGYDAVYAKVRKYAAAHPEHELALPFDLSPHRHLNSGVAVARVWAYKEFIQKATNLTRTQTPPAEAEKGWHCDQSIYIALYLDLIVWEVERDVFSMPSHERQGARSPYGVRAGFIGLDFVNVISTIGAVELLFRCELHDEHWAKYLPVDGPKYSHSHDATCFKDISRFVSVLYRRAYATCGEGIFTRLAVSRWDKGTRASGATHIILTPPLFAMKLRPIDTVGNTTRRTFPVIFHAAGSAPSLSKVQQLEYGAVSARWFVPMMHDPKAKRQAMEYLASVPLFLSMNHSIIRDSYYAKCGFPFGRIIRNLKNI